MVWPLLAAQGVKMFMDERDAEARQAEQRRQAAMGIAQANAARLGAPSTAGLSAARTLSGQAADDAARHRSQVSGVVQWAGGEIGKGLEGSEAAGAAGGPMSAIDQDYMNNPPAGPGADPYGGAQFGGDADVSAVYDRADSALAEYDRGPMDRPTDLNREMDPHYGASDTELLDPFKEDEDEDEDDRPMYGGGGGAYGYR